MCVTQLNFLETTPLNSVSLRQLNFFVQCLTQHYFLLVLHTMDVIFQSRVVRVHVSCKLRCCSYHQNIHIGWNWILNWVKCTHKHAHSRPSDVVSMSEGRVSVAVVSCAMAREKNSPLIGFYSWDVGFSLHCWVEMGLCSLTLWTLLFWKHGQHLSMKTCFKRTTTRQGFRSKT